MLFQSQLMGIRRKLLVLPTGAVDLRQIDNLKKKKFVPKYSVVCKLIETQSHLHSQRLQDMRHTVSKLIFYWFIALVQHFINLYKLISLRQCLGKKPHIQAIQVRANKTFAVFVFVLFPVIFHVCFAAQRHPLWNACWVCIVIWNYYDDKKKKGWRPWEKHITENKDHG